MTAIKANGITIEYEEVGCPTRPAQMRGARAERSSS